MNLADHYIKIRGENSDVRVPDNLLLRRLCESADARVAAEKLSPGEALGQTLSLLLYDVTEGLFKGGDEDEEELYKFLEAFYNTFNQWSRYYHE